MKPTKLYVKPRSAELVVRDPRSLRKLKATGNWVPDTVYWRRRIISGDVLEVTPPEASSEVTPPDVERVEVAPPEASSESRNSTRKTPRKSKEKSQ